MRCQRRASLVTLHACTRSRNGLTMHSQHTYARAVAHPQIAAATL